MANLHTKAESVIQEIGDFTATHSAAAARYYLYFNSVRVGQINSGKHPAEVYGSVSKWIDWVVKRSEKRIDVINQQTADLVQEESQLHNLIQAAHQRQELAD